MLSSPLPTAQNRCATYHHDGRPERLTPQGNWRKQFRFVSAPSVSLPFRASACDSRIIILYAFSPASVAHPCSAPARLGCVVLRLADGDWACDAWFVG